MKPTLVVLAAGMGSRYGGVKQIDPVGMNGEAIIDYSIYDAIRAGFNRVIFVIRREIEEDVKAFFAGKFPPELQVDYVYQDLSDLPGGAQVPPGRSKPWGTGHAMLAARDSVDAPFAVINGDDFYGRPALVAMAEYLSQRSPDDRDYAMVGYRLDRTLSENGTVSRGIVTHDDQGWLTSIVEHTRLVRQGDQGIASLDDQDQVAEWFQGQEPVSMNLFGFTPAAMDQFWQEFGGFLEDRGGEPKSEFYIPYGMNRLNRAGKARMKVLRSDSEWFGVTYQEDRPQVVARIGALIEAGDYPRALWPYRA
ncbi:MobA-like NTP transferase domain-containing protein [Alkalispirochaeta americana]|uniref:MobA-like NTP transferase domain-containing protein n=1 Tax=Alkalispirochaeta americana TaxID=159291 RepID=A0A1N6RBG1_9SPIO|nr:NTP transferase domain-containing protein [Alkalispirochaeta americana]SIQ26012.1 MobA-like NTP transferase domain-containing protein [Alkalispirochaeta americana]